MKLTIFSRYSRLGASSRLRSMQYLPALERAGFEITLTSFFDDDYLQNFYAGRRKPLKMLGYFAGRIGHCRAARSADVIWIEKEALPWFPWAIEGALLPSNVPFVVDYDDSVFHRYDQHGNFLVRSFLGRKIDRVMAAASCVTVGNSYLEARARAAGSVRIERVPTVIDLDRYDPSSAANGDGQLRVGWIGTPRTWKNLAEPIHAVLRSILETNNATFRAIGASLEAQSGDRLEIVPWVEDDEVDQIRSMQIGVMPLPDDPWTKGKCGYKLIQYMGCGLPVVASPVGVNCELVEHGVNGFLASTNEEWRQAIGTLLADPELRMRMGAAGRRKVEQEYSLQVWGPKMAAILSGLCVNSSKGGRVKLPIANPAHGQ